MKVSRFFALSLVLLIILFGVSSVYSEPFRFVSMADSRGSNSGVNDPVLSSLVDLIIQEDAEFVLFPGDLVYGHIIDSILISELNHWRDLMAPIYIRDMYGAKVYAGPGNHEIRHSGSEAVWQSVFNDLPSNGPSGETYMTYSFNYLNSHFVMLNTDRAGNPHTINYNWLANDLSSTTADHIFVFGHEPAYPVRPHLGDSLDFYPDQRDAFWQLLVDYDVDIYFAGHEHLYNHTQVNGVHQVINGTSGAPIHIGYGGEFYHYALVTVDGLNVSVEIIDDSGAIRDSFELASLEGVPLGAIWKYLDDGTNQATAWRSPVFDDSTWLSGAAQLGYGDRDEVTVVYCGPSDPLCNSNNYITTYFRHSFEVADTSAYNSVNLRILRDDGAVVYLNGTEVLRTNMPGGAITYTTPALSAVGGADETVFHDSTIDPGLLVNGTNVLAVEIHQFAPNSSDISFNLELLLTSDPVPDIKANGSDGPITIPYGTNLTVTIALDPGGHDGEDCDWWVVGGTSFGFFWYTLDRGWVRSDPPIRVYGGPLFDLPPFDVLDITALPVGTYTFCFGVDLLMNGLLDDGLYYDCVNVSIGLE
ncbi:MAG: metallophosphoesterase family protein [Planctomycetota bacterium]